MQQTTKANRRQNSSVQPRQFDVLVVGLGTTGMYAAKRLAAAGKHVAVFEKGPRGTMCIRTGCMPSKALFVPAHHVEHLSVYKSILAGKSDVSKLDIPKLFDWMRKQRKSFIDYRLQSEDSSGFTRIDGEARLIDAHTVVCNDVAYCAPFIVLCTGSKVSVPQISGLSTTPYFTSDNLFEQKEILGKSIIIFGGGVIGCEMAQFFCSIGFKVTIIARHSPLLRMFDDDVSRALENAFLAKGIKIVYDEKVESAAYTAPAAFDGCGKFTLVSGKIKKGSEKKEYIADNLLVSAGRSPNHATGIELAGVKLKDGRIVRNGFCQTSVPHIYSGGDESGIQLLHEARQEGEYIANHILGEVSDAYTSPKMQIAFTYPHIASVGAHEKDLVTGKYLCAVVSFDEGRSILEGATSGMMKITTDLHGKLLGASCVNDYADHLIQSILPYVQYEMHVSKITDCYHPTQQEVFLDLRDDILAQLAKHNKI